MNLSVLSGKVKHAVLLQETAPIPDAAGSKAWVRNRLLAGIVDSNPAGGKDVCFWRVLCVVIVLYDELITRPMQSHRMCCPVTVLSNTAPPNINLSVM